MMGYNCKQADKAAFAALSFTVSAIDRQAAQKSFRGVAVHIRRPAAVGKILCTRLATANRPFQPPEKFVRKIFIR